MTESNVYTGLPGIAALAKTLNGGESIHIGIRPYELHAGNKLAIIVYPILICEELRRLGKSPRFTFLLSLNDWEQRVLVGTNIYEYTYDVKPLDVTIQYAKESDNKTLTAPFWGGRIIEEMAEITRRFPDVTVKPFFNSDLHNTDAMKTVVLQTLIHADEIKELMLRTTNKATDGSLTMFAASVCPSCHDANTDTQIQDDTLSVSCSACGHVTSGIYEDFMYWLHHKPLFAARWKAFGFTHSLSGGDHLAEGDVEVRRALYSYFFNEQPPKLDMIFSPILLGADGNKMSKSRDNYFDATVDELLRAAKQDGTKISLETPELLGA